MISLRRTILVQMIGLLTAISVIATLAAWLSVKLEVNGFLDNQMRDIAVSAGQNGLGPDSEPQFYIEGEDELLVQIWDHDKNLLHRTGPDWDIPLVPKIGYTDITLGPDQLRIYRAQDADRIVQIAQRWSARHEVANKAAFGSSIPLLISLPIAWLLLGWSLTKVLGGLSVLSADIGGRSVDAKSSVDLKDIPSEIHPLIEAMNALIERHQRALDAQRRFVADAAHELRTPLAALQLQVDNMAKHDLAPPMQDIREQLEGGVRRSSALVVQLLGLARADAPHKREQQKVQLAKILTETIARFVMIADKKNIQFVMNMQPAPPIPADPADIDTVLSALLENALRYSEASGTVSISLACEDGRQTIGIIDEGPGIPEEALPFVFERFFRSAPQGIEGSGLGLSIAKAICDRNHIGLSVANRAGQKGVMASMIFAQTSPITGKPTGPIPATDF